MHHQAGAGAGAGMPAPARTRRGSIGSTASVQSDASASGASILDFRIHFDTAFGESVLVLGSGQLGGWRPSHALHLHYDAGWWRGRLKLRRPAAGAPPGAAAAAAAAGPADTPPSCRPMTTPPLGGDPGSSPPLLSPAPKQPEALEYKYAVRRVDGILHWEDGPNRVLFTVEELPGVPDHVEVRDTWRSIPLNLKPLYSKAFTGVVFRRDKPMAAVPPLPDKATDGTTIRLRLFEPRVAPSHRVFVSGSCTALGRWDPDKALPLTDAMHPCWSVAFVVRASEPLPVQYKYVIRRPDGSVVWEGDRNRLLDRMEVAVAGLPAHATLRAVGLVPPSPTVSPPVLSPPSLLPSDVASPYESGAVFVTDNGFHHTAALWRGGGVAVPVASLRSRSSMGVGEFADLKLMADVAAASGLSMLQLLPINDSMVEGDWRDTYPYKSVSVIALHPMYIRIGDIPDLPPALRAEADAVVAKMNAGPATPLDYDAVIRVKLQLLHAAFDAVGAAHAALPEFTAFVERMAPWLRPYALFCVLRDKYGGVDRGKWAKHSTVSEARVLTLTEPGAELYPEVLFWYFVQFHLHNQLISAAQHATNGGVVLKGDLPVGVSGCSVDAWLWPHLFSPDYTAGAPPDYFAPDGQNWGFPTYNWEALALDGYQWWQRRLQHMATAFSAFRIDHVLGFLRMWSIPSHAVTGLLGRFVPAVPIHRDELERCGIWDLHRLTKPYIRTHLLKAAWGASWEATAARFLVHVGAAAAEDHTVAPNEWEFLPEFNTERKLQAAVQAAGGGGSTLLASLFTLVSNVVLLPDEQDASGYHPRIEMASTSSFKELPEAQRQQLYQLYLSYFYHRQEALWTEKAMEKLPAVCNATDMLVCGEDLGMVPACMPTIMSDCGILSLKVQRMPSDSKVKFSHPADYEYMSVCTTSTHDMPTLRGWWREDAEETKQFARELFGVPERAVPERLASEMAYRIVEQHCYSPSMWAVFPIQDLLATYADLRAPDDVDERINVPANPVHYWRWRLHLNLEDLLHTAKGSAFCEHLRGLMHRSGRGMPYATPT